MKSFPDQTVSEGEKKKLSWIKEHFEYADMLIHDAREKNDKMTLQLQKFTGETNPLRHNIFSKIYGRKSQNVYKELNWTHSKIMALNNEYARRPLPTHVYSRARHVVDEREKKRALIMGAYMFKNGIQKLKDFGVDPLEGMPVPEDEDQLQAAMELKTETEAIFSSVLKNAIEKKQMILDFAKNNLHIICSLRAFGKVEMLSNGKVEYVVMDPRDAIIEYHENDPMAKRSRIKGSMVYMNSSEIIKRYGKFLTDDQRKLIITKDENPDTYRGLNQAYRSNPRNNTFEHSVTHIEWKTLQEVWYKVVEDKKDPEKPYRKQINPEQWVKQEKKFKAEAKAGKYKLEKEYEENLMHAVRIGHNIYVNHGYKPYCLPDKEFSYSYIEINTVDGKSLSLVDLADEINFMIDVIHMKIKELIRKYIGNVIFYDEGMLPKGKDVTDVVYDMMDKNLVRYNTAATGNASQINMRDNQTGLKVMATNNLQDLQQLIIAKNDLKRDLDELTSVNKERQGESAASQSATGVRQNMSQSRVMTHHIFLATDIFAREILQKYAEYVRISLTYIESSEENNLLDDLGMQHIKLSKEVMKDRIGVQLMNIEREVEIREDLNQVTIPTALQQQKIEVEDVLRIKLTETTNESINVLEQSMARVKKLMAQNAEQEHAREIEKIEKQNEGLKELSIEQHRKDIEKIVVDAYAKGVAKTLEDKNKAVTEKALKAMEMGQQQNPEEQVQQQMQ